MAVFDHNVSDYQEDVTLDYRYCNCTVIYIFEHNFVDTLHVKSDLLSETAREWQVLVGQYGGNITDGAVRHICIRTYIGTDSPTTYPTRDPTEDPSIDPTTDPTAPTPSPTTSTTDLPTDAPTDDPTPAPTSNPTTDPTTNPTHSPSEQPSTNSPTIEPTTNPTMQPTVNYEEDDTMDVLFSKFNPLTPSNGSIVTYLDILDAVCSFCLCLRVPITFDVPICFWYFSSNQMHFEMDIEVHSFPDEIANVFHCGSKTEAFPIVFVNGTGNRVLAVGIRASDISYRGHYSNVTIGVTNHIEIDISQGWFKVQVNGAIVIDRSKSQHSTTNNVSCYVSSPHWQSADSTVTNIRIYSGLDYGENDVFVLDVTCF